MASVHALMILPAAAALLLFILPWERLQYLLVGGTVALLAFLALGMALEPSAVEYYGLSRFAETFVILADVALLLYFVQQGGRYGDRRVIVLAAAQLLLYGWAEAILPETAAAPIVLDGLSRLMFPVINVVGGIIVVYALGYMAREAVSPLRRRLFVGYLLLFLSVMNAVVVANSLLLFFFLFEMTTLASYLLIAFRNDEIARANALRALWMNQVGGVAILLGTLAAIGGFGASTFSEVLAAGGGYALLPVALVSIAALVKGASLPFDGWLLGAMVAPTPVSAMLHSAAMVKIAPYLILKLSPALAGSAVGMLLALLGAGVFVAASYLALSRSVFKEILGYSTVALLGLMMSLAAVGDAQSTVLAQALLLFHALSKALLFLAAGVVEKLHHVKDIEAMKGLVGRASKSVGFILFGFVSLTLPPFGLFMGKLFAIASVASQLKEHPWLLAVLLGIVVGSTLLVLLYFKVASALLSQPSDVNGREKEALPAAFAVPLWLLALLTLAVPALFVVMRSEGNLTLLALPLLLVALLPGLMRLTERFDRSPPYHCGEKEGFDAALVYFAPGTTLRRGIYWLAGAMFGAILFAGVFS